jgi:hypothetical protein
MADLAQLIANAQKRVQTEQAAKTAKAAAKARPTPEAMSVAHALQAQLDWRTVALVFKVERWTCTCGCTGDNPLGLFLFEEHTRVANSTRLVRPRSEAGLPPLARRTLVETSSRAMCADCCSDHHFIQALNRAVLPHQLPERPPTKGVFVAEWEQLRSPEQEPEDADL